MTEDQASRLRDLLSSWHAEYLAQRARCGDDGYKDPDILWPNPTFRRAFYATIAIEHILETMDQGNTVDPVALRTKIIEKSQSYGEVDTEEISKIIEEITSLCSTCGTEP